MARSFRILRLNLMNRVFEKLRVTLAAHATADDRERRWPERSLAALAEAGAWRWVIPREYGGLELDALTHLHGYEAVAAGCFATLLILANRDGACELLIASENDRLRRELLPRLARNECFTTIGISQLTTSHQTGPPTLTARHDGGVFVLNGFMPWVTGALECQFIVTGAVVEGDGQLLIALPTDSPGLVLEPPMPLVVMEGTHTSRVVCREVRVEPRHVLRGPAEKVLATRSGVKPALVASAGIGLAGAMLRLIEKSPEARQPRLTGAAVRLRQEYESLRGDLYAFAADPEAIRNDERKARLRVRVNELLMRLGIGVLTYSKGAGLHRDHEAQRLLREAMFYQVWASPEEVRAATLERLLSMDDVGAKPSSAEGEANERQACD